MTNINVIGELEVAFWDEEALIFGDFYVVHVKKITLLL